MIKLEIKNKNHDVLAAYEGEVVCFTYDKPYSQGIIFPLQHPTANTGLRSLTASLRMYDLCTRRKMEYAIPYGEKLSAYGSKAFVGNMHTIKIRYAHEEEIYSYRNVAINSCDKRELKHVILMLLRIL